MRFIASRLSEGNKMFPDEITIDDYSVTVKSPKLFGGTTKSFPLGQITISIHSPMIGFSDITLFSMGTSMSIHGFTSGDAKKIKSLIESGGPRVKEENYRREKRERQAEDDAWMEDLKRKSGRHSNSQEYLDNSEKETTYNIEEPDNDTLNSQVLASLLDILERKIKAEGRNRSRVEVKINDLLWKLVNGQVNDSDFNRFVKECVISRLEVQAGKEGRKVSESELRAIATIKYFLEGKTFLDVEEGYQGDLIMGEKQGKGTKIYKNGDVYEGDWLNNERHGVGKYIWNDGDVYEGEWKNGSKWGVGKMIYNNGDVYEGEWKNGEHWGKGKTTYKNGDVYSGEWKNGSKWGEGKMIYKDGDVYEGEWVIGNRDGTGKMTYKNGDVFDGVWRNVVMHGNITFKNGDVYEGIWPNDNDNAKMTYKNGDVYEGEMLLDKRWGEGKMTYKNGDVYEGNWLDDKMTDGKMIYKNGDFYEGEWENNKRWGEGKMTYKNGDVYEGEWEDNEMCGKGKMLYQNGEVYEGVWQNGIKV